MPSKYESPFQNEALLSIRPFSIFIKGQKKLATLARNLRMKTVDTP